MEYKIKKINKQDKYKYLPEDVQHELINIALAIMDVPRGIMMLDDTPPEVKKALDEIDVDNKEEVRERFIKLILSTPFKDFISSLTFPDDAITMLSSRKNKKLVTSLTNQGYILGFKASQGEEQLFGEGDYLTVGLDQLVERCTAYKRFGFKFAVWKNLIRIGNNIPSNQSVITNSYSSARFAAICQSQSMVPIVGFEISNEGSHTLDIARKTLEKYLSITFRSFGEEHVFLEGVIIQCTSLKSRDNIDQPDTPENIAEATIDLFSRTILTATKGIQIISGSLSEDEIKQNLNALFNYRSRKKPWLITFSVGRNLQTIAFELWRGKLGNSNIVRNTLRDKAKQIMDACSGKYDPYYYNEEQQNFEYRG